MNEYNICEEFIIVIKLMNLKKKKIFKTKGSVD